MSDMDALRKLHNQAAGVAKREADEEAERRKAAANMKAEKQKAEAKALAERQTTEAIASLGKLVQEAAKKSQTLIKVYWAPHYDFRASPQEYIKGFQPPYSTIYEQLKAKGLQPFIYEERTEDWGLTVMDLQTTLLLTRLLIT